MTMRTRISMSRLTLLSASLLALLLARPAGAQLAVEVRGGAGAGSYEATGAGFQNAPRGAFAASASYAPLPALSVYAGYSRASFGCEEGFCRGVDPTFTTSGVGAGLRASLPLRLWARAGVVRHQLAVSSTPGGEGFSDTSDPALGVEAGLGLALPLLGSRFSLTPGVGYLRYGASLDGGDRIAVVTADVGLRLSL